MAKTEIRLLTSVKEALTAARKERKVGHDTVYPQNCVRHARKLVGEIATDFPGFYRENAQAFTVIDGELAVAAFGYDRVQENINRMGKPDCPEEDHWVAELAMLYYTERTENVIATAVNCIDTLLAHERQKEINAVECC